MSLDDPQPPGFKTPGIYINRFDVRLFGQTARIVFSDAVVGKHGAERAHIVMSTDDAEEMGKILIDLAQKHRASRQP